MKFLFLVVYRHSSELSHRYCFQNYKLHLHHQLHTNVGLVNQELHVCIIPLHKAL